MADVVDWSLDSATLRKKLLLLSKSNLIKACKYKHVPYKGSKKDAIDKVLSKNEESKMFDTKVSTDSKSDFMQVSSEKQLKSAATKIFQMYYNKSTAKEMGNNLVHFLTFNGLNWDSIIAEFQMNIDINDSLLFSAIDECLGIYSSNNIPNRKDEIYQLMKQDIKPTQPLPDTDISNVSNDMKISETASILTGYIFPQKRLDPIARILLIATHDENNIWYQLGGMKYIVKAIWELALQFNAHIWPNHIDYDAVALRDKYIKAKFPSPRNINVNMMPFIMSHNWQKTKLPDYLIGYHKIIQKCLQFDEGQRNKICFLTVQESMVDTGKTQRRPGLHVECPGNICICNELTDDEKKELYKNGGGCTNRVHKIHPWGMGYYSQVPVDGLYMASNVGNSCAAWHCKVVEDTQNKREVIGHVGDIEHLRSSLVDEDMEYMGKNKIYWLTDRTPHESLPMKKKGYRQFFRLVTHKVGLWYKQHSAANPNGVIPDAKITRVIKGSKFKKKSKKKAKNI